MFTSYHDVWKPVGMPNSENITKLDKPTHKQGTCLGKNLNFLWGSHCQGYESQPWRIWTLSYTIRLFVTTKLMNQMNVIQMIINKISSYNMSFTWSKMRILIYGQNVCALHICQGTKDHNTSADPKTTNKSICQKGHCDAINKVISGIPVCCSF